MATWLILVLAALVLAVIGTERAGRPGFTSRGAGRGGR
jgi:hypothetical protein